MPAPKFIPTGTTPYACALNVGMYPAPGKERPESFYLRRNGDAEELGAFLGYEGKTLWFKERAELQAHFDFADKDMAMLDGLNWRYYFHPTLGWCKDQAAANFEWKRFCV